MSPQFCGDITTANQGKGCLFRGTALADQKRAADGVANQHPTFSQENVLDVKRITFEKFHSGGCRAYRGATRPRSGSLPPYPVPPHLINISYKLTFSFAFLSLTLALLCCTSSCFLCLASALPCRLPCIEHGSTKPQTDSRHTAPGRSRRTRTHPPPLPTATASCRRGCPEECPEESTARWMPGRDRTRDRAHLFPDPRKRTAPPFCMDATWMQGNQITAA